MADRRIIDRVGRVHLHAADDLRVRPYCGYFGITEPVPDDDLDSGYECTECRAHLERRVAAQEDGRTVPQPGRTLL